MSERVWSGFQQAIFEDVASGEGHTVVRARAGSGKTSTIVEAFNHVPKGATVLMCAFNKAIAQELESRAPMNVDVKTLHAYGLRAVSKAFDRLPINDDRVRGLAKAAYGDEWKTMDRRAALKRCVSLAKGSLATTAEQVGRICDVYGLDAGDDEPQRRDFVRHALSILEACKVPEGSIDFDDMVWLPVVHDLRCWQYDYVFIDETQDLNAAQIALALKAVKPRGRIVAVGDDRQAIYQFRGADEGALGRVVSELGAKVLPLSVTYRCARAIVREANKVVEDFEAAPGAPEGAVHHCDEGRMMAEAAPGDFILSRINAPLVRICLRFLRDGKRAHIQGRDIGAQLTSLVTKAGAASVPALAQWVDEWCAREVARLSKREPPVDAQAVEDKAETIHALSEGATSVAEVLSRIGDMFRDDDNKARITLSSTHKAKGLERDRAWVLADTYQRRPGQAEANLKYVAVSRAKNELFLVRKTGT